MTIEATDSINIMAPVTITDAMLTATNISPEDSTGLWSGAATYAKGERRYLASTHRVYENLQDGNTNKDPSVLANQVNAQGEGTWWQDVGPTNRWAMFDTMVSTQSQRTGSISFTLTPGAFNGFAFYGLDGDHIHVVAKTAPGGSVYFEYDEDLEDSAPADYYEYFFDPFKPQTQLIQVGLLPYASAELTVTVTKTTGEAKIGMFAIGLFSSAGAPLRGAVAEPQDFSYISTDSFGVTTLKKRHNATGLVISGQLDVADASSTLDIIKRLLGVPCVVIGSTKDHYLGLTAFGLISARAVYAPDNKVDEVTINYTVKGLV